MIRYCLIAIPLMGSCGYAAGSFSHASTPFPGARSTVGCLDVAAALKAKPTAPVLSYSVGNRCDFATTVDFASLRVRSHDGALLTAYDPRSELRPLSVEARTVITEQIEYRTPSVSSVAGVCVDVGSVNGPSVREQWICVGGEP